MYRILKILFGFLLLLTLVEAGYYLFVLKNVSLNIDKNEVVLIKNKYDAEEINSYVNKLDKGSIKSVILINVYEGKVTELEKNGGSVPDNNKLNDYKVKLTITPLSGDAFSYYFKDVDLLVTKINEIKDGIIKVLQFNDLQIGDKVKISISSNLQKQGNSKVSSINITKID